MPKPDEFLFALKIFSAAMLAYYISCWLGLNNPYWSMATAFIVGHPLAGATRSKAVYRFFGTLVGASAAVLMVPVLVDAPLLLCLAMAFWVGLCLYISLMDRSARAYAFMLAGYTAGIIGFPSVMNPGNVFQTALTRCEEISLGIACTSIINSLIMPRSMGPILAQRVKSWVQPGVTWASEVLAGESESAPAREARQRLAFEATDTAMMISQLGYDTSHFKNAVRQITRLRLYLISIMPILAAIGPRVAELRRVEGLTEPTQAVLSQTEAWLQSGKTEGTEPLLDQIQTLHEESDGWAGLVRSGLALRLEELVRIALHSRQLRQHVLDGDKMSSTPALEAEYIALKRQSRDHKMAFLSAFSAALSILLVCFVWIESGWVYGAGAAVLVAVACSFFASQHDPAPSIASMLTLSVIIIMAIFVYDFAILPRVSSFEMLYMVLFPVGLIIGLLVARPATFSFGMVLGAFGATQLALQNGYNMDFISYAESSLSLLVGLGSALVITRLIRSVGAAWSAEQLMRANWRDVANAARANNAQDRATMTGLMMDRLGLMMPRLAAIANGADAAAAMVMRDTRVGLNLIGLHQEQWRLPPAARTACQHVFGEVATYYKNNPRNPAPVTLQSAMDASMSLLIPEASSYQIALRTLSGLRLALYPEAAAPLFPSNLSEPEAAHEW